MLSFKHDFFIICPIFSHPEFDQFNHDIDFKHDPYL